MNDALGNEIVIGSKYGFSRNKNGFHFITIGEAIKTNELSGRVTLKILQRFKSEQSQNPKEDFNFKKETSCMSFILFKIN